MPDNMFIIKQLIEKNFPDFTGSFEIHMCDGEVGTIKETKSQRYALKKKKNSSHQN